MHKTNADVTLKPISQQKIKIPAQMNGNKKN